jgi:hypothetical protein
MITTIYAIAEFRKLRDLGLTMMPDAYTTFGCGVSQSTMGSRAVLAVPQWRSSENLKMTSQILGLTQIGKTLATVVQERYSHTRGGPS